ncbi:hypothetical protein B7494_g4002, partial [Chlorociboria aeruginascens]
MENGVAVNGTSRPRTPSLNTLSLTEYSTNPSPPSSTPISKVKGVVPDEFLLPNGYPDYLRLILTSRVYEVVEETPLTHATNLSNRLECKVMLKREDLQPVFSFKLRGAYNKMAHLDQEVSWKGVVACSAGRFHKDFVENSTNDGQGTPSIKHLNVSRLGGSVVLHGADFDAAKEECGRLEKLHGLTNIPPFDDPYVIAGQGTIGMELLRQTNIRKLKAIFCCVGGGGLIAGIGVYVKRIAPDVKIIGVETYDANAMVQSLEKGHRVFLKDVGLFADGAAVKTVGEETFRLCQEVVDEVIQVTTDETCAAIKDVFEDTRSIVEPAGALAVAGLKKIHRRQSLSRYLQKHDSIANVLIGISLTSPASQRDAELSSLLGRIAAGGMTATDLSGDELAKSHIRYLVGGRSQVPNERLYMLSFPERPGALEKFLRTLRPRYSISLFQYRNAGSDIGKMEEEIVDIDDYCLILSLASLLIVIPRHQTTEMSPPTMLLRTARTIFPRLSLSSSTLALKSTFSTLNTTRQFSSLTSDHRPLLHPFGGYGIANTNLKAQNSVVAGVMGQIRGMKDFSGGESIDEIDISVAETCILAERSWAWQSRASLKAVSIFVANSKTLEQFIEDNLPSSNEWASFTHPTTKISYTLTLHDPSSLSLADLEACFNLISSTSKHDYQNSQNGWKPRSKWKEMQLLDLKYLVVRLGEEVKGFMSFMPTYEDEIAVVYCYEIHLEIELRGAGLGQELMTRLYGIAQNITGVQKVMLTVFVNNERALNFYRKLGFEKDAFSPEPRVLRNGTKVESEMSTKQPTTAAPPPAPTMEQPAPLPLPSYRVVTGAEEWHNDIFDCLEPTDLCLKTTFCPCFTFGKTQHRLREPSMATYERINPDCGIWLGLHYLCGAAFVAKREVGGGSLYIPKGYLPVNPNDPQLAYMNHTGSVMEPKGAISEAIPIYATRRTQSTPMAEVAPYDIMKGVSSGILGSKRGISTAELDAEKGDRERVVILGSGWAGFVLSRTLSKQKFQTVVVSPRSYFVFTPLLASTAVGTLEFRTTLEPVRARGSGISYFQGWADDVHFATKTLKVEEASIQRPPPSTLTGIDAKNSYGVESEESGESGRKGQIFDLTYDKLVVSVGCYSQTFGTKGVRENALFLKDVVDARKIRKRVLECFETAALPTTSATLRKHILNFAIVGGGPTGVEFAAELFDLCHEDLPKLYPDLVPHVKISIYDVAPKILPMFDASLANYALGLFRRDGIQIKTEHHIEELKPGLPGEGIGMNDGGCLTLKTKEDGEMGVGMCVWSTGLMMNPFIQKALDEVHTYPSSSTTLSPSAPATPSPSSQKWSLKRHLKTGGLMVDDRFRVKLIPQSSSPSSLQLEATMTDVFALGDVAVMEKSALPATAQVANQEAKWLGKRLNSGDLEDQGFAFRNLGVMTYLGNMKAIMQTEGQTEIKGRTAWLIWRGAYLTQTISWRNKLLIPIY